MLLTLGGCGPSTEPEPEPVSPPALTKTPSNPDSPIPLPPTTSPETPAAEHAASGDVTASPHPVMAHPLTVHRTIIGDAYQGRFAPVREDKLYELASAESPDVSFVKVPNAVKFFGPKGHTGTFSPDGARLTTGCGGAAIIELVFTDEFPKWSTLGITGDWNPLPRVPSDAVSPNDWKQPLRQLLTTLHRPKAPLHISKLERVDLQGDGRPEVLVQAAHTAWRGACRKAVTTECRTDDAGFNEKQSYAILAVAMDGKGPLRPVLSWTGGLYTTIKEAFYVDVDGDNNLEVISGTSYYEGNDLRIYSLKGNELEQVLIWDCSV